MKATSTEEAALLAAIDAAPDDDAPRLAHADWLEAQGDIERAEYVRQSLIHAHHYSSDSRLIAGLPTVNGMTWSCRRGYPEVVRFESLTAFQKGWRLTAGHRVRHVVFGGAHVRRSVARLAAEPALAEIPSLELSHIETDGTLTMLRSPHLTRLRHLSVGISYTGGDPNFLPALAEMPLLAGLQSLEYAFFSTGLPEGQMGAFLRSPHLGSLRGLRFSGWLRPEALRAMWRSTALAGLRWLEFLGGNSWSQETRYGGLEELGDGACMPNLERLCFGYTVGQTDPGVAVGNATRWRGLRRLDLLNAGVGDAGAAALAAAPHLASLESLALASNRIGDAGATALADSPHLRALQSLDLSANLFGRAGVAALGRTERLPRLRRLALARCPAPALLVAAVEARFSDGGPPVAAEEVVPVVRHEPVPLPSAPLIGAADEDGLVRAIWADPYDDAARLVYADWLEEQGKPHHAAVLRAGPGQQREAHFQPLLAEMQGDAPCVLTPGLTDEGLIQAAVPIRSLRSRAFQDHGPGWLRRHHVAEVRPVGQSGDWEKVLAGDWLAHARGLSFRDTRSNPLAALTASPHLATLASLTLAPVWVTDDVMTVLFRDGGWRGLCRLMRPGYYLPVDAVKALCASPSAPHLRHLCSGVIQDPGLVVLIESPAMAGLVTLALGPANGPASLKVLADTAGLQGLRNLNLSYSWTSDLTLDVLAGSRLLGRLRRLRLRAADLSVAALRRLVAAAEPSLKVILTGNADDRRRQELADALGDRVILGGGDGMEHD